MDITVKTLKGETFDLSLSATATLKQLKENIAEIKSQSETHININNLYQTI